MAFIRVEKRENPFVMLDKTSLNDERLSWKAKGLHAYLISLPDDWKINVAHLATVSKDGRDSTTAALKELEQAGYLYRERARDEEGKITGVDYVVRELPESAKNPQPENPDMGKTAQKSTNGKSGYGNLAEKTTTGKTEYGKTEYGKTEYGKTEYGKTVTNNNKLTKEEGNQEEENQYSNTSYSTGQGPEAGKDLFGVVNPQPGTDEHPETQAHLSKFLSVSDQTETLLYGWQRASKQIPFLRVAYQQIFGCLESETPDYGVIGGLLKTAESIMGNRHKAGEALIRLWVMHTVEDFDLTGASKVPVDYTRDKLEAKRKAQRQAKAATPTKEEVVAFFNANGSDSSEGTRFFNYHQSRLWEGVYDWKPLALNRIEDRKNGSGKKPVFLPYNEALKYWQNNTRSIEKIPFARFFKPVDARGRDWDNNHPDNAGKNPLWLLVATPEMYRERQGIPA